MAIFALVLSITMFLAPQADTAKSNADAEAAAKARQEEMRKMIEARYMAEAEKHARINGKIFPPGKPFMSLPIPDPITKKQLEHLAYMLQLSDAQMQQFNVLFEKYLDEGWAYRKEHTQPLWDRSAELAEIKEKSVEWSDAMTALKNDAYAEVPTLRAFDRKLVEAMRPYLSDEQIALLGHAHKLRDRQCARELHPSYLGGRYDLTETLYEFSKKDYDMTPRDREQFEHVLTLYETEATELFDQFFKYQQKHDHESSYLFWQLQELGKKVQKGEATREEIMPDAEPIRARLNAMNHDRFVLERRIHRLNERYVNLFAEQLPDETGNELRKWWREKIYRYVYPDPYDLEELLTAVESLETLTDEQRTMTTAASIEYRTRVEKLTQAMLNEFNTWNDEVSEKSGYDPRAHKEYVERFQKLQTQRHENADKAIASITAVLDDAQRNSIRAMIDKYDQSVKAFDDKMAKLPKYSPTWPGPWSGIVD